MGLPLILGDFAGIWTQIIIGPTPMVFALILGDFAGFWTQIDKFGCKMLNKLDRRDACGR